MDVFGTHFFDGTAVEERRIGDDDNIVGAVVGKNACELDILVAVGLEPRREAVDVSRVAVAASALVTAAFGSKGTI